MTPFTDVELATRFIGFIPLSARPAIYATLNGAAIIRLGVALYEADLLSADHHALPPTPVVVSPQQIDASLLTLPEDMTETPGAATTRNALDDRRMPIQERSLEMFETDTGAVAKA